MSGKKRKILWKVLALCGLGIVSALVARERRIMRKLRMDLADLPRKH